MMFMEFCVVWLPNPLNIGDFVKKCEVKSVTYNIQYSNDFLSKKQAEKATVQN